MDTTSFEDAADAVQDAALDVASDVSRRLSDALGDAQRLLKEYPAVALIGAVVIGFAAGRLLRRS